jgi:hypothetical protein
MLCCSTIPAGEKDICRQVKQRIHLAIAEYRQVTNEEAAG